VIVTALGVALALTEESFSGNALVGTVQSRTRSSINHLEAIRLSGEEDTPLLKLPCPWNLTGHPHTVEMVPDTEDEALEMSGDHVKAKLAPSKMRGIVGMSTRKSTLL
jgi:hypothetical protein